MLHFVSVTAESRFVYIYSLTNTKNVWSHFISFTLFPSSDHLHIYIAFRYYYDDSKDNNDADNDESWYYNVDFDDNLIPEKNIKLKLNNNICSYMVSNLMGVEMTGRERA